MTKLFFFSLVLTGSIVFTKELIHDMKTTRTNWRSKTTVMKVQREFLLLCHDPVRRSKSLSNCIFWLRLRGALSYLRNSNKAAFSFLPNESNKLFVLPLIDRSRDCKVVLHTVRDDRWKIDRSIQE